MSDRTDYKIISSTLKQTAKDGNLFMSILTLVSSLLIIIVFLFNDNLRAPNYYFLLAIAISELLGSVSIITNFGLDKDQSETLISFILNLIEIFSDFFVTLFITFIAYCIYILIVKGERDSNKKVKLFIIVGTIVSVLYTIILAIVHIKSAPENSYSKIKLGYYSDNQCISQLIHYIIILIITAVNIFFFIRTIIFLNAKNKQDKKNGYKLMKTRNLLINYPLIGTSWIVLSLISFIIQNIISGNNDNDIGKLRLIYIFIFIANLFTYLRGAFIFIIFIKSKKVTAIFYSIGACLYRCLKKINMNQMPSS